MVVGGFALQSALEHSRRVKIVKLLIKKLAIR